MTADTAERRKWRKKPVVIEATQWFKNGDHPDDYVQPHEGFENGEWRQFSPEERKAKAWEGDVVRYFRHPEVPGERECQHCGKTMHEHGWIDTLEGGHIVCPGDWVITGVKGEFYPCKPDIFEATYEPADEARAALPARAPEGLRIVFDGMPGPEGPRFVEVEDATGHSVNAGDWRTRPDGLCELVIKTPPDIVGLLRHAVALIKDAEKDTNWTADSWTTPEADRFVAVAERALSTSPPPPEPPASPAPGPAEPVVRALEWRRGSLLADWWAGSLVGRYEVGRISDDECVAILRFMVDDEVQDIRVGSAPSNRAAKAAAQADYERRILSALTPPQPALAPVAGGEVATSAPPTPAGLAALEEEGR